VSISREPRWPRPYIRAMQLGSAHNIGSAGSGCKDAPAHRSEWPRPSSRLRTSKGPCHPSDRADFPSCGVVGLIGSRPNLVGFRFA